MIWAKTYRKFDGYSDAFVLDSKHQVLNWVWCSVCRVSDFKSELTDGKASLVCSCGDRSTELPPLGDRAYTPSDVQLITKHNAATLSREALAIAESDQSRQTTYALMRMLPYLEGSTEFAEVSKVVHKRWNREQLKFSIKAACIVVAVALIAHFFGPKQ